MTLLRLSKRKGSDIHVATLTTIGAMKWMKTASLTMSLIDKKGNPYQIGDGLLTAAKWLFETQCAAKKDCTEEDARQIGGIVRHCIMDGLNLRNGNAIDSQ